MNEAQIALSRYRLGRAQECLDDARLLLANGKHNSTGNRAYYAAFYAVRALLALKGLDSSRHSGAISFFNREYVKAGLVQPEYGRTLNLLFEGRMEGDYRDLVTLDEARARSLFLLAEEFVAEMERVFQAQVASSGRGAPQE